MSGEGGSAGGAKRQRGDDTKRGHNTNGGDAQGGVVDLTADSGDDDIDINAMRAMFKNAHQGLINIDDYDPRARWSRTAVYNHIANGGMIENLEAGLYKSSGADGQKYKSC